MRQIVIDTETTGMPVEDGHRIIEIGCVELINRKLTGRTLQYYINPEREVDAGALAVHGLSNEFLKDKPTFAEIVDPLLEFFADDAEFIIHNAAFDLAFLNAEIQRYKLLYPRLEKKFPVIDTLLLARQLHPGQKNNLDALCKRYDIDNNERQLHGALLDAMLLTRVYLAMTGGQIALWSESQNPAKKLEQTAGETQTKSDLSHIKTPIIFATDEELKDHQAYLEKLKKTSGGQVITWE